MTDGWTAAWYFASLLMIAVVGGVASHRGRPAGRWALAALLFWPVALVAVLVLPARWEQGPASELARRPEDVVLVTLGAACMATLAAMALYALTIG